VERGDGSSWLWLRVALVVFVLAWILGPSELRDTIPIWLVFLVALGLEVAFVAAAFRGGRRRVPDRRPQQIDRDRYGYDLEAEDAQEEENEGDEGDEEDEEHAIEPDLGRSAAPLRRFALGIALIAALVGVVWIVEGRTGWDSVSRERRAEAVARMSAEASRVVGKPVSIRCDEARDYVGTVQHADGVAEVGGELAILTPEICDALYRLAFEGETRGSRTGRAIAVLAHEAWHLRGERDEGVTECYAVQSGVGLGRRLGLSESTARQLMRQQLTENALRGAGSLEYRVPSECRDGGRLDLDAADGSFP
jgi:hypothetical protein